MTIQLQSPQQTFVIAGSFFIAITFNTIASAATKVRTASVPNGGQPVVAKTDAGGIIHLLFQSPEGPHYAKSLDKGESFTRPIPVVDRQSQRPRLEFEAHDMVIGQNGRIHVALGSNAWKLKLPQEEWGYYYAQLERGGQAFSPLRNINGKPSEGFSLAADGNGNITACWLSGKLYANRSRDNGQTFGPNIEIDQAIDPCDCCTTSAAYVADGRLAVLYREETNNDRDMYLALWDQERNVVQRNRVSSTLWKVDGCPMTYFTIARSGDGLIAAWPTKGRIYFAHLPESRLLSPPSEIMTPGATGMRMNMIALTSPTGETLVVWREKGDVRWQLYDERNAPSGEPVTAASPGSGVAAVLAKNGEFIMFR